MAAGFPLPGLDDSAAAGGSVTELLLSDPDAPTTQIDADMDVIAGVGAGPTALTASRNSQGDYALDHASYGRFSVDADGLVVRCEPRHRDEPWRWQRFLVGQVLPLVAVLRGLEALHASAVAVDGRGYLFTGPSGAGKTTVALGVAACGGTLLADDVAVLDLVGDQVVVHPGAAVASVKGPAPAGSEVLGMADGESRLRVAIGTDPVPIRAVFMLDPQTDGDRVRLRPVEAPVAPRLLGTTFNAYVNDRARIDRQFELLAGLGTQARVISATVPRSLGVGAFVRELRDAFDHPMI